MGITPGAFCPSNAVAKFIQYPPSFSIRKCKGFLQRHLGYFSELGERSVGSEACNNAANYISEVLNSCVFSIKKQQFPVYTKNRDKLAVVQSCNIIATKEGETPRKIVLSTHYDGYPKSSAANDNASGVLALLTLAHVLSCQNLNNYYTIEIVMPTAEEVNSQGAFNYLFPNYRLDLKPPTLEEISKKISINTLENVINDIKFIISLDCVGKGRLFAVFREELLPADLIKKLDGLEAQNDLLAFDFPWEPHQGDGALFMLLHLPTICFGRYDRDISAVIHTKYDSFSLITLSDIIDTVRVCLRLLKNY